MNLNKVVFDIEFVTLPTINMVYGYKSGSELLKRIAKRLEVVNETGVLDIFKSNREEFIVCLVNFFLEMPHWIILKIIKNNKKGKYQLLLITYLFSTI
ncbi:MAG TPA: hypothetical protein VJ962_09540 [Clostridia bacterium]|nr:hypothetical protein [Clostridia bacterium]